MRDIKFRGLRTDGKGWLYGFYQYTVYSKSYQKDLNLNKEDGHYIYPSHIDSNPKEVIPDSIGQFTGLKDKNNEDLYEEDLLRIDKSNLSKSFQYSKAGEVMIEKELDAFLIHVEKSDYLSIKIKTYLEKDGKLLTKKDYYGEDIEDESLYFETGIDVRFLKYVEPFCEKIGNTHENPELIP